MPRREPSLFWRLVLRVGLVLLVGATVLISAAWYYGQTAADRTYDQLLRGAARQMAANIAYNDGQLVATLPSSAFELLGIAERDRIFYKIVGPDGEVVSGYPDLDFDLDLEKVRSGAVYLSGRFLGEQVRAFVLARALPDPDRNGWAYVIVAQTTEARQALARDITQGAMLIVCIMVVIALGGTLLAVRYALRPITGLAEMLRKRDPEDLTPLLTTAPLELQPFVGSINHFMQRLDERVVRLQRFIADAAHQIRTPLTALAAQIDLLEPQNMSAMDRSRTERIRDRTGELSVLTNQLLSHAMVIHRSGVTQFESLDLVDVARSAFSQAIPMTVDPDIIIGFEAFQPQIFVEGDAVSLREAMANVISNALRHGAISRLDVRVMCSEQTACVEVEDDGPGIPPEARVAMTRRFTSASEGKGVISGLGFAIAAEVVAAHDGEIRFRHDEGSGFVVILHIPVHQKVT